MRQQPWHIIPVNTLDQAEYGRTQRAWRHTKLPALLLLHRPRSRGCCWYERIAVWTLTYAGVLVRRRPVYGRQVRGVPWRWVDRQLRAFTGPPNGQLCHVVDGRRPTTIESIQRMPARADELPPVLAGHHLHRGRTFIPDATDAALPVVLAVPLVPPGRTLNDAHADHVLTQEEHAIFVDFWRRWMATHPEFETDLGRAAVRTLCLAEVRLWRVELVSGRRPRPGQSRLLHRAYLHHQRLRVVMGATRHQRHTRVVGVVASCNYRVVT